MCFCSTGYSVDISAVNANTISNFQYAVPDAPSTGHDCDQIIADPVTNLIVNNTNICITDRLEGEVRFEGTGGKLQIAGIANISSFYSQTGATVRIEILPGGQLISSDNISLNLITDTITNWGELDLSNSLSLDGVYRNFDYAYVKVIVNSKSNTIYNTDTLILNNSLDNYGYIHNYGYVKDKWGYISNKYVSASSPTPGLINYTGATIDLPNNHCYNSGFLSNSGTINSKHVTNKSNAECINTGVFSCDQTVRNQNSATITNSGSIITLNASYASIDLAGGVVSNSGIISSATDLSNYSTLINSSSATITTNNGGLLNDGTLTNSGEFNVAGNITNKGSLANNLSGSITNTSYIINEDNATFTNDGVLDVGEGIDNYSIFNNSSSISLTDNYFSNKNTDAVFNNTGSLVITDNILYNKGIVNNGNEIVITGILYNNTTGEFYNENNSTLVVTGSESVQAYNYDLVNYGILSNNGTLDLDGLLHNESGSSLINASDLTIVNGNPYNYGTITNSGNLTINVHFYNYGDYYNTGGTTAILDNNFYNYSTASNSSNLYVGGNFYNNSGSSLDNSGLVETAGALTVNTTLINSYRIIVGETLTTGTSSNTTLEAGALTECYNLYTQGTITSDDYYSSIYVDNTSTLKGTISGLVDIFDKTGINSNSASCAESVVFEDKFTNNVLALDGANKYISVNASSSLNVTAEGTIEVMVKPDAYNANSYILNKEGTFSLKTNSTGKQVLFTLQTSAGSKIVSNGFDLNIKHWYHIVASWDSEYLYFYINGVLIQKVSNTVAASVSGNDLYVGTENTSSAACFEGYIDNIRLWNKSVNKDDVWDMFGANLSSQNNLLLNLTFESAPTSNSYFVSSSSSALKAYLSSTFDYSSADLPLDEVRQQFSILNKHYTDYDIVYIKPDKRLTVENNVSCNNVVVAKNGVLEIPADFSLTLNGNLYLQSDVDEYALLLEAGTLSGTGDIHIEQSFLGDGSWEFKTVPAPVTDFSQFGEAFDEDYAVYYYDQNQRATGGNNSQAWKVASSLKPGIGYIFKFTSPRSVVHSLPLETFTDATYARQTISYTTSPNGDGHEGWNLVGNPFNTRISWDKMANRLNDAYFDLDYDEYIGKCIYVYNSSSDSYKYYVDGISVNGCDSIIDPFKAFFIKSGTNTSNFQINKSLYPSSIATRATAVNTEKSLSISLANDFISDETVVRFSDGATEAYDFLYDAYKLGASAPYCQVYTRVSSKQLLSINTLPVSDIDTTFTLYVKCTSAGTYSIVFNNIESFVDEDIYLIDKTENTITNLKEEAEYSFNTDKIGEDDRFLIVLKSVNLLTDVNSKHSEGDLFYQNKAIVLREMKPGSLKVYNMWGQAIFQKQITDCSELVPVNLMPGVYIATINNTSTKLIIR